MRAHELQRQDPNVIALIEEAGYNLLDMLLAPIPEDQGQRFRFPKCPHCKRRPELIEVKGQELEVQIRPHHPAVLRIPKYQALPCCSAHYVKTVEHLTRLQKIRGAQQVTKVVDGTVVSPS